MSAWEVLERFVKVAGIVSGAAAAIGVLVQVRDINQKEQDKKIEDWQSAVVFRIIESSDGRHAKFDNISTRYTSEALKFPSGVPREKLDDAHLQLVLLKLIQGNAVYQMPNGDYGVSSPLNEVAGGLTLASSSLNEASRQIAIGSQITLEQLLQSNSPLTIDQLLHRVVAAGGNAEFLKDNFPMVLQQLNMMGQLVFTGDGRVAKKGR